MNIRKSAAAGAGLAAFLLLAACARGEDAQPIENATVAIADLTADEVVDETDLLDDAGDGPLPTDAWTGRWMGAEGLTLNIQPAGERGRYVLSVTRLDGTKSYDGTADGDAIRFTRDGRPESIRPAAGAETGQKWLAEKQNCLMIQQGEAFCRDDVAAPAEPQP